jgi:hypothetical protein
MHHPQYRVDAEQRRIKAMRAGTLCNFATQEVSGATKQTVDIRADAHQDS